MLHSCSQNFEELDSVRCGMVRNIFDQRVGGGGGGGWVPVLVCERDIEQWREREIEKGLKGKHGVHISLSMPIAPTKQRSHGDISTILRLIAPCPPTPGMDLQFAPHTDTYILSPLTYLASQPVAILISTSHQLTART